MTHNPAWPRYESEHVRLGNSESSVAVCCLWTDRRRLAPALDPAHYAALGNLYSVGGIGPLVRNLLANPRLRHLVVCGADLTGSGAALVGLFGRGLEDGHRISGTDVLLDRQIPLEAVESLRRRVQLVDLRGTSHPEKIDQVLATLPPLPPQGELLVFPEDAPSFETLPSEGAGYLVRQTTVARAWLEVLKLVTTFGEPRVDEIGRPLKELLDLVAVVSEPPDRLFFPSWLPISSAQAGQQADELWNGASLYGQRLRQTAGADQLAAMIRRLRDAPASRRAVAVLWDPGQDLASTSPPCLCWLSALVHQGEFALTALFRSHELGRLWPLNLLTLRLVQGRLAKEVGVPPGPLVAVSQSAHLYVESEPPVIDLLAERYPRLQPWRSDPRGIFHIRLENGQIVVEHGIQNVGKTGRRFSGPSAQRLYKALVNESLVLLPEHAAYLGAELQKAEIALELGIPYEQDEALDFGP